jgi:hypothetical protein
MTTTPPTTPPTTPWAHLPNAPHVDRILADLKARPAVWDDARDAAWDAAWDTAWHAAWDAAWDDCAHLSDCT